jgi:hypothetical protein
MEEGRKGRRKDEGRAKTTNKEQKGKKNLFLFSKDETKGFGLQTQQ